MLRSILRNMVKNQIGSSKIRDVWRSLQRKKYGVSEAVYKRIVKLGFQSRYARKHVKA